LKKTLVVTVAVAAFTIAIIAYFALSAEVSYDGFFFAVRKSDNTPIASLRKESSEFILSYTSAYSDCTCDYFRNKLENKELHIYNAVSYAVDKGYSCIYFPEAYFESGEKILDIVMLFACDSPFLEYNFTAGKNFTLELITIGTDSLYMFEIPSLVPEKLALKKQAYDTAKSIIAEIPDNLKTDRQKSQYLYSYIVNSIKYADIGVYDFDTVALYDALCLEADTICDGFADCITMLMNLAGVPTFSVSGVASNTGQGHAVNMLYVGGRYYYADASADSSVADLGFKGCFSFLIPKSIMDSEFTADKSIQPLLPIASADGRAEIIDTVVSVATLKYAAEQAACALENNETAIIKFESLQDTELKKSFENILSEKFDSSISVCSRYGLVGYTIKRSESDGA